MDPWERVSDAAAAADLSVRSLTTLEEADAAVAVMRATWGDENALPREAFRALQESGNLLHGAVRDGRIIAFALGWFGRDEDGWHLHSHMLAVEPGLRSSGVGYALKMAQRAASLEVGVTRMRWTFDPLQSRNAYFNLTKIGARADAFHRNFYGDMPDELNRGDRSDRLVIRWDFEEEPPDRAHPYEIAAPVRAVAVPEDIVALKESAPQEAARWRDEAATGLEKAFAEGLEAAGFSRELGYLFVPKDAP